MKLVILDRDGVINQDSDSYIKTPEEWIAVPGSLDAIARLKSAGYLVAVATNQSGLGRGLFDEFALARIHQTMCDAVEQAGGLIDGIFFCPHAPDAGCHCRKPATGLLEAISSEFNIPLAGVPLVGDSLKDLQAALAMGCKPILVRSGKGEQTARDLEQAELGPVAIAEDLAQAVNLILETDD